VSKVYRLIAWVILIGGIITFALRITALRWWQVPPNDAELGASVGPTLRAGDWVLLWRLTRPSLGDLVVCPDPDDPTNVVMGRIVAEAGDQVTIHGQKVLVNDKQFDIEYNCTERMFSMMDPETQNEVDIFCDMENVNDVLHMRGYEAEERERRKFATRVESGKVFLLSDNRAYPFDSRHFGSLERLTCTETVFFRLVSEKGFFDVNNRLDYIR
jgi:signal peptidase I